MVLEPRFRQVGISGSVPLQAFERRVFRTRIKVVPRQFLSPLDKGNLRINRLRLDSGSFLPRLRFRKREIRTVFLRFLNLVWK